MYYAVFFETFYDSLEDAVSKAPDVIAAHRVRSNELHALGTLLMSGAFLNNPKDPFVLNGMVSKWYIREWANMFA